MKKIFAAAAVIILAYCPISAVTVTNYKDFQTNAGNGGTLDIHPSYDIIRTSTTNNTVSVSKTLTVNGNGRKIDQNGETGMQGNIFSVTNSSVTVSSVTIIGGNYTISGGAIKIAGTSSKLYLRNGVLFQRNRTTGSGGAIYADNGSIYGFDKIYLNENSAQANGGAVALAGGTLDFSAASLSASTNTSTGNGAFIALANTGKASFGKSEFTNNMATSGYGGVAFSSGANTRLNFNNNVTFADNKALRAGAIYLINGAQATFLGQMTSFERNQGYSSAAAFIIAAGAKANFQGNTVNFLGNAMTNNNPGTGAIHITDRNSSADFRSTNLIAQTNNAGTGSQAKGGFMRVSDSASVYFGDFQIGGNSYAQGNIAEDGGGIYAEKNAILLFYGNAMLFGNNKAAGNGGALFISENSQATSHANASPNFVLNTAAKKGGAVAISTNSQLVLNSSTVFRQNSADLGGAVSIEAGSLFQTTDTNFSANKASSKGGAIYMKGAIGNLARFLSVTSSASVTLFAGNSVNDKSNALYLDEYSLAEFRIQHENSSVIMRDSVTGSSNAATVRISGKGNFNLFSTFDTVHLDIYEGNFNIRENAKVNAGHINIYSGGNLNISNEKADTVYAKLFNLESGGILSVDILQASQGISNDEIITETTASFDTASTLKINAFELNDLNFRKRIYRLINYSSHTGTIGSVGIIAPISVSSSSYKLEYDGPYQNWMTLTMLGNRATTEFSEIEGETFNQKETGKALDKISASVNEYDDWDLALANLESYDENAVKNILTGLSGYFLPNIVRNAVADIPNDEIYDRIRNHCVEGHSVSNGLWAQIRGGKESFYGNENSVGDYTDTSVGFMAGYDKYMEDKDLMLGAYARYSSDSIEQGKHEADGKKTGIGIYGGYIQKDYELKALTLLSFDSFDIKRYVPLVDSTAKSELKSTALSFDFEGALKYDMDFYTKFRPYAGLELANASYKGFSEQGAGIYNLKIDGGNYLRTAARIGAGLEREYEKWRFYGNIEGKYIFSGTEPEIKNSFSKTSPSFKTKGAKEGAFQIGLGGGATMRITNSLKAFANADFYAASKYTDIYANIGLRYTFCNPATAKEKIPEPDYDDDGNPRNYAQKFEEDLYIPDSESIDMHDDTIAELQKAEALSRRIKPDVKSYSLNTTSFSPGKAILKNEAKNKIAAEAANILEYEFRRIVIEGHTDSSGNEDLNIELSKARAKAVYEELIECGIPGEKMMYVGFGSKMPKDTNATPQGRANNRRVEIYVE